METASEARMNIARFEANMDAIQAELNRLKATASTPQEKEDK